MGVATYDVAYDLILQHETTLTDTVRFQLVWQQMLFGDTNLVFVGVAEKLDHLHTIQQSRRNRVETVGGGDEDRFGSDSGTAITCVGKEMLDVSVAMYSTWLGFRNESMAPAPWQLPYQPLVSL